MTGPQDRYAAALPMSMRRYAFMPTPIPAPLVVNATVVDAHDGDTFVAEADLTDLFGVRDVMVQYNIRILGMAARELKDPGGPEARANLLHLIEGRTVVLATMRKDNYGGRTDAVVTYLNPQTMQFSDLATDLIQTGWAVPWNGRGAQPKPEWPRVV